MNRYVGNLPPMRGCFQDSPAPVVLNAGAERFDARQTRFTHDQTVFRPALCRFDSALPLDRY